MVRAARERAAQVQQQAQAEATRLLEEADDYVDRKLGEFEVALDKLDQQVQRGRQHLSERSAADRARGIAADVEPSGDDVDPDARRPPRARPGRRPPRRRAAGLGRRIG